jgi:hypothetical protein
MSIVNNQFCILPHLRHNAGIYIIKDTDNNVYIGRTNDLKQRFNFHKTSTYSPSDTYTMLQNPNTTFELLTLTYDMSGLDCELLERQWINFYYYNTNYNVVNSFVPDVKPDSPNPVCLIKDNINFVQVFFKEVEQNYINKWCTKEELKAFIYHYKIKNKEKKFISVCGLCEILSKHGYNIQKKRKQIKGSRVIHYFIYID